jgi:hypothetical protein
MSKELLALTGIAAIISAVTTLIALVLKEYFFARSLEAWKERRSLTSIYRRYRDPLFVAAVEFANRLHEVTGDYGASYLRSELITVDAPAQQTNSVDDMYFQKYKLVSTICRLSAFLGWLELYRQELVFLDAQRNSRTRNLEWSLDSIRSDLADGQLNTAKNWMEWRDVLIFREEQRAIGEAMLETQDGVRRVIGYAKFCEEWRGTSFRGQWIRTGAAFLLDPDDERDDFRQVRIRRLVIHLTEFADLLHKDRVSPWLLKASANLKLMMEQRGFRV